MQKAPDCAGNEPEFHKEFDRILSNEELRLVDCEFENRKVPNLGVIPKIDPQVEKYAQRDLKLAMRKREALENQRKSKRKI